MKLSPLFDRNIVFIIGFPCSGKDTLCSKFEDVREIISVSDIVKKLKKSENVSDLNDTIRLDDLISMELCTQVLSAFSSQKKVFINGVRQMSIVINLIVGLSLRDTDYCFVYLDVPETELKRRYEERSREGDNISFEELLELNKKLGLNDLIDEIKTRKNTLILDSAILSSISNII